MSALAAAGRRARGGFSAIRRLRHSARHRLTENLSAHLQKVRRGARPCGPLRHELAHALGHRIGLDDVFDRGPTIGPVGILKGARRPICGFAGGGPERKIGHARQPFEPERGRASASRARRHRGARRGSAAARARTPARALAPAAAASHVIGLKVMKMARSPRSGRVITSSMPLSITGRAAANSTSS